MNGIFAILRYIPHPSRTQLSTWGRSTWQLLQRTPPLVFAMAVLGAGLIASSSVLVKGIRQLNDTVTVTGASTEKITSDHANWSLEISQAAGTQQQSYQELQPLVQKTVAFLRSQGITAEEIKLDSVTSEKEDTHDPRTGELKATTWTTSQIILISSQNVGRIDRVSQRIDELIGQGVPLKVNRPEYTYTGLAEKRVEMLAKATRDARERAKAIAWEAGSSIGSITNAETGSFQITAPNSTEVSDSGSYDTKTIDKDITAVMTVTFRVE